MTEWIHCNRVQGGIIGLGMVWVADGISHLHGIWNAEFSVLPHIGLVITGLEIHWLLDWWYSNLILNSLKLPDRIWNKSLFLIILLCWHSHKLSRSGILDLSLWHDWADGEITVDLIVTMCFLIQLNAEFWRFDLNISRVLPLWLVNREDFRFSFRGFVNIVFFHVFFLRL